MSRMGRIGVCLGVLFLTFSAQARQGLSENYGLSYVGRGFGARVNPASLLDRTQLGLSGFAAHSNDRSSFHGAVEAPLGPLAMGVFASTWAERDSSVDLAAGVALFGLKLGVSYVSLSEWVLGAHTGQGRLRYSFVVRDIANGVSQIGAAIAYHAQDSILALDVRKPTPVFSGDLSLTPSLAVGSERFFAFVNYTASSHSNFEDGTLGGGVGGKYQNLGIRLLWNPHHQEVPMRSLALGLHYEL